MKKIFSAFLLMTMMVASVGSFVSCSDIEDAIAKVENTANDNAEQIETLKGTLATLQTALAAAQADAAAAKTAADKATQAAAQAQVEAIAAAKDIVEKAIADLQNAHKTDIDAVNKAIADLEAKLALKADVATVEQIQKTLEIYAGLGIEDKAEAEAVAALLAKIEAGEFATAESVATLVEEVKAINEKLAKITKIVEALANQIQSITYVPENIAGTIAAYEYVTPKTATTDVKSLIIKAEYEVSPKNLASKVTNVKFATVDTKAAAAEYFDAEVASANDETGRIVVYGYIPQPASATDEGSTAYQNLTAAAAGDPAGVSVSLVITDANEVEIAEGKVDLGSYVQSAYVNATGKTIVDVIGQIGFKQGTTVVTDTTATYEVAYNAAVADSKKNIFAHAELVVDIDGKLMTIAEASEFLGTTLTVTNTVGNASYAPAADEARVKAATKYTKSGLATTVEFSGHATSKPKTNDTVTATINTFKVNGQDASALTATGIFKVINPTATAPVFGDITAEWDYKAANFDVPVSAIEVATSGVADIAPYLTSTSSVFVYNAGKADETKIKVTRLSSAAVEVSYEGAAKLQFKDEAKTYTFTSAVTVADVDYTLSLNVNVGAKPKDNKVIDLGTYTRTAITSTTDTFVLTKNIVDEIIKADAEFYGEVSMADRYEYFAKGAIITPTTGNTVSSVTYTYMKTATAEATTAADAKSEKTVMTLPKATVEAIEDGHKLAATVTFRGVTYKLQATVNLTVPQYALNLVGHYFDANGKVKLVGEATVPTITATTASGVTTLATSNDREAFELDEIFLNDYFTVAGVTAETQKDVEVYYELQNTTVKVNNVETTIAGLPSFTAADQDVYAKDYPVADDPATTGVDETKAQIFTGSNKASEFTYKVYLRSTELEDEDGDPIVYDTKTITLYVPQVATLTAPKTVEVEYTENGVNTANVVGALKVVDLAGKDAYNPYATNLDQIFKSVSGNVTAPSFGANVFDVYGQTVSIKDAEGEKNVKVMVNGVETTNLNYTITDDGQITLANDAVINSSVEFHVTVYMNTMFDNATAQTATAVVKFVK